MENRKIWSLGMMFLGMIMVFSGCGGEETQRTEAPDEMKPVPSSTRSSGSAESRRSRSDEQQPDHPISEARRHGGMVVVTPLHHFEIVSEGNNLRVYGYDAGQRRLSLKGVSGRVRVHSAAGVSEWIRFRFHPEKETPHQKQPEEGYLEAHWAGLMDRLQSSGVELSIHLTGVPGTDQPVEFRVPYGNHEVRTP